MYRWANNSDAVIISIDYFLTQDNKFPKLFDEIFETYEFIVTNTKKIFSK